MSPLRQKMIRELQLQRMSANTVKAYTAAVEQLARYYGRSPENISTEELRHYLYYLIVDRKLATSSVNVRLAGIQFLYRNVLQQDDFNLKVRTKRSGRLPQPLSRSEIGRLLEAVDNRKHRVMLMTSYASGVRVGELVNLQVKDVHSQRMLLHVRSGKGDKDRFTLLSVRLLNELRAYWMQYRPETWLFPNRSGSQMAPSSIQHVYYQAKEKAAIETGHGIHSLRHYADIGIIAIPSRLIYWKQAPSCPTFRDCWGIAVSQRPENTCTLPTVKSKGYRVRLTCCDRRVNPTPQWATIVMPDGRLRVNRGTSSKTDRVG
jgi:site-specific recombinase XerD